MKTVELSDETEAALRRLAESRGLTVAQVVEALVRRGLPPLDADNLLLYLTDAGFLAISDPTERYLALLAWCATHHSSDFADFISHQPSGFRYLALTRDEIQEVRAHNHARQIDGTQFWAVMTIDAATRWRFVRRLLEFIGCPDVTVAEAGRALGFAPDSRYRLLGVA